MLRSATVKKIANNTLYQLIGKLVSMSITVLATILVTRAYAVEGFGEFSLMQNIPALFFIIVDFGFNAISTRELSKNFEHAEKYFANILIMRFFASLSLIIFVTLAIQFLPVFSYSQDLKLGIYLGLFLILTQAMYATTNVIFQAKLRYDLSNIGYIIGSIVILVMVLLLTGVKAPIMWVNFSYVVGGVVTFVINLYLISKFIDLRQTLKVDRALMRSLSMQSLPLGLMFIFSQINFKADSILLSIIPVPANLGLNETEAVAIYNLPYKIFEVALVMPTFLMNAVYPVFVRHLNESKERFLDTFFKTVVALGSLGVFGGIVGWLASPLAIEILGGPAFQQSTFVLRLLLVGLPIFYITQPISWLIVTLENQSVLPYIYLVSAIFNFGLNLLLIPKYSFYAAAPLTWLSEVVILVLLIVFARKVWSRKYA